jgi:hypothetical protein
MMVKTDWISVRPNSGMCAVRNVGRKVAAALPSEVQMGAIFPGDDGLMAFIIGLELALEEARTGRLMTMSWHIDNFHSFYPPKASDVEYQLSSHPDTNILPYSWEGQDLLKKLGFKNGVEEGLLIREGKNWKPLHVSSN